MCGSTGAVSRSTTPGQQPQPAVRSPCSSPASNSTCMPTQMPSTGRAGGQPLGDDLLAAGRAAARSCTRRTRRRRARPGRRRRSAASAGRRSPRRRRRPAAARAGPSAGCPSRSRAPRPAAGGLTGRPWCWGWRRAARGSGAAAARSARANALNCASTMWCGLRPVQHVHVHADARRCGPATRRSAGSAWCRRCRSAGPCRPARCARRTGGRTGRPPRGPASRPAAPARRRTGRCPPCRRAPRAAPGRAPARCPRRCGARRPRCRPGRCTVRSSSAVLAELGQHVVEERHAGVGPSVMPVPSSSSSTETLVSLVARSTCADRLMHSVLPEHGRRGAARPAPSASAAAERGHLRGRADA